MPLSTRHFCFRSSPMWSVGSVVLHLALCLCVKCGAVGREWPPEIWEGPVVDTVGGSPFLKACLSIRACGLLPQLGEILDTVRATRQDQGGSHSEEGRRPTVGWPPGRVAHPDQHALSQN